MEQLVTITRLTDSQRRTLQDVVAAERCYHIYLEQRPLGDLCCSPMDLEDLVTGALFCDGHIQGAAQIDSLTICGSEIRVTLGTAPEDPPAAGRMTLSWEAVCAAARTLFCDPDTLFCRTGCAHSCALLRGDKILCIREDIGRHNALDKVIGYALRENIPLSECAVVTSGRISGEYMAKIIRAGIPVAVSRAAVTSEAVRLAREQRVQLYGFVRGDSANLYTE